MCSQGSKIKLLMCDKYENALGGFFLDDDVSANSLLDVACCGF